VGVAIHAKSDKTIRNILSRTSSNDKLLVWLKDKIVAISQKQLSLKTILKAESEIAVREMRKEKIADMLSLVPDEDIWKKLPVDSVEKIKQGDEAFFKAGRAYYTNFIKAVQEILNMPYPEAYRKLEELTQKTIKDTSTNPGAVFVVIFAPTLPRLLTLEIRYKTSVNALSSALDIYAHKAKTGQLPEELPAGLPGDLFSGKPFKYEKNADGFILRCQGKDLSKDEIHQYEFKVKK
jgi:hypothetical protein